MAKLKSLDDLFVHELQDIFNAEQQITKALPKMVEAAAHDDLRAAFEDHLEVTEGQIVRLEQVFRLLGLPAKGRKCEAMAGILEEGGKMIEMDAEAAVKDAGLISAAQKVEHYEIAAYGCVATYAEMLGYDQIHQLLRQTLAEEEDTDEKLTTLAEQVINPAATRDAANDDDEANEETAAEAATAPTRPKRTNRHR